MILVLPIVLVLVLVLVLDPFSEAQPARKENNRSHEYEKKAQEQSQAANQWLLVRSGPGDPAFNMALDEALLEAVAGLGKPVLRFYSWSQLAASFGYFQKYSEVERMTLLRPLVRRPTAGGLVPHDADWTYSLVFPPHHPWYSLIAVQSYHRVHLWIQAAFAILNIRTELAPCGRKAQPGQCFAGYETSDLLWQGQKIAGAAQRRNRAGLLIEGSVQPPPIAIERSQWEQAMCEVRSNECRVSSVMSDVSAPPSHPSPRPSPLPKRRGGIGASACAILGSWEEFALDGHLMERTLQLAAQKYSQPGFNQKR